MSDKKSLLIVLTTGRASFEKAVNSLRKNISMFLNQDIDVDLLVNYDLTYQSTLKGDFEKQIPPLKSGGEILFAGPDFIKSADWVSDEEKALLSLISPLSGYGQKKNACLLYACRKQYDRLLFWDDDEMAVHITKEGNDTPAWTYSNVIGQHVAENSDVSFGFWTGYVSPIPDSFFRDVDQETKSQLTQALSKITDVVSDETFFNKDAIFSVPESDQVFGKEIVEENGGKWISGGNLSLKIDSVKRGLLPGFFTPTDSRGDDSIFSTRLKFAEVCQVPAGIFHDAFNLLSEASLANDYERPVAPDNSESKDLARFAGVLRGWIAYAPLLTLLRGDKDYLQHLSESVDVLKTCEDKLLSYFGEQWKWSKPSELLQSYTENLNAELSLYEQTQDVWRKLAL